MKYAIVIGQTNHGPFDKVEYYLGNEPATEETADRYNCDGLHHTFTVFGRGQIVDASTVTFPAKLATPEAKVELLAQINAERDRRFYSDVSATFPAGSKTIQFRDERDRANFAQVVQGAMALVSIGQPGAIVSFITADNDAQSVPASDFVALGLSVMAAKQGIIHAARALKDLVEDAELAEDLPDVTAGWP